MISLLGIVGLLLLVAIGLALWPDAPPPDEAALLPDWGEASTDNPLAEFQEWLEQNATHTRGDSRIGDLRKEDAWDPELATEVVTEHADELEAWDRLAKGTHHPWYWQEGESMTKHGDLSSNLPQISHVASLVTLRARLAAEEGRSKEALADVESLVAVASGLQQARGNLVRFLIAETIAAQGIETLSTCLEIPSFAPSDEEWGGFQSRLAHYESDPSSLRFALQAEYAFFRHLVDAIGEGDPEVLQESGIDVPVDRVWNPYLNRNTSLSLYAGFLTPMLEGMETDLPTGARRASETFDALREWRADLVGLLIHPNGTGNVLVSIGLPVLLKIVERAAERDALYRLLPLRIALHRFQKREGTYPEDLEELVPDFLPEIPADPFGEGPFLWNPETRAVYSVGPDETDHGGQVHVRRGRDGRDIGFELVP